MQLGNNDALSPVNNEGAFICHQGQLTKVNILFLDGFNDFGIRRGIFIVNDQT